MPDLPYVKKEEDIEMFDNASNMTDEEFADWLESQEGP